VIDGLYASGGAAEGISGHGAAGYLAGNGLLPALGLAYLAADHLAGISPHSTSSHEVTSEEGSA
jgi:fumarate reductase flavoprotein subunit